MEMTLEVRDPRLGQEHIRAPGVQFPGNKLLSGLFTQCLEVVPTVKTPVREDWTAGSDGGEAELHPAVTLRRNSVLGATLGERWNLLAESTGEKPSWKP